MTLMRVHKNGLTAEEGSLPDADWSVFSQVERSFPASCFNVYDLNPTPIIPQRRGEYMPGRAVIACQIGSFSLAGLPGLFILSIIIFIIVPLFRGVPWIPSAFVIASVMSGLTGAPSFQQVRYPSAGPAAPIVYTGRIGFKPGISVPKNHVGAIA